MKFILHLTTKGRTSFILHPSSFILLFLVACAGGQVDTAVSDIPAIPVAPEFEAFYTQFDGQRLFGEPVTEIFTVEEHGRLWQYFRAVRLEYDESTDLPVGQRITVSPLGEWALAGLNEPLPVSVPENIPSRYFSETDQTVSGEFLAFYEANRGEQLLGPPISPQLDEGGLLVQYFRNGRLERRPELSPGQRILVSSLGQAHFDTEMAFTYYQTLLAQPVSSAGVTEVDVFTAVRFPILYIGEEQTLYITVLTPSGRPVPDLRVNVAATHENTTDVIELGRTNNEGTIQAPLNLDVITAGQQIRLTISVYASNGEVIGTDNLTFKTWW